MKGCYGNKSPYGARKNKPNQIQFYLAPRFSWDLKKQSQFSKGRMNLNIYYTRDYKIFHTFWQPKNKANSKPIWLTQKEYRSKGL